MRNGFDKNFGGIRKMKRLAAFLMIVFLLSGCTAKQIKTEEKEFINEETVLDVKTEDSQESVKEKTEEFTQKAGEVAEEEKREENKNCVYIKFITPDGVMLETDLEFKEGMTAFELTKIVLEKENIFFEYSGGEKNPYIKGIGDFYEMDLGPMSGWLFFVNEKPSDRSCGEIVLQKEDKLTWHYYENCFEEGIKP